MPIYEYKCDDCGHELETIQKLSEEPLKTCPECNADALVKKISAAGFRLKGGGWYETDFKSGSKRNLSGGDDGGEKSSEDSGKSSEDSGKADSKDAAKTADSGKTTKVDKSGGSTSSNANAS